MSCGQFKKCIEAKAGGTLYFSPVTMVRVFYCETCRLHWRVDQLNQQPENEVSE